LKCYLVDEGEDDGADRSDDVLERVLLPRSVSDDDDGVPLSVREDDDDEDDDDDEAPLSKAVAAGEGGTAGALLTHPTATKKSSSFDVLLTSICMSCGV
jgi:hypothetical protein